MSSLRKMTMREAMHLISKLYESFGVKSIILLKDKEWINLVTVIHGDAVAWCDQTPLFPAYLVWFDGTMSCVSWGQTGVIMPYTITLLDYWLTWGVGTATISSGGAGDTYVTFLMSGLAVWYLYVDTRFYQYEPYVTVTIMASTVGVDYDSADLILCC